MLKDGTSTQVVDNEVTDYSILYHRYDNLEGPLYKISRRNVTCIVYKNGLTKHFADDGSSDLKVRPKLTKRSDMNTNDSWGRVIIVFAYFGARLAKGDIPAAKRTKEDRLLS